MSLAKQEDRIPQTSILTRCAYVKLFETMPKDDQETLLGWINVRKLASRVIVEMMAREGYKLGNESLNNHRYGRCRCSQEESK